LLSVLSLTEKTQGMGYLSTTETVIAISIAVLLAGLLAYIFIVQRRQAKKGIQDNHAVKDPSIVQLKLQAYERLTLLADRIALPNLISRCNQPGLNVQEMQNLLAQTIRQEFDHNITQQIYVSPEAWDAVRNLKEQNLLIIHQVASFMPAGTSGQDLNKSLLEMVVQNPKASLHSLVSEALSFEAKKVLG